MNSTQSAAAIVTLPAEVDMYNREQAYDQVYAACFSGAYVIIADFTGTRYCDAGGMRRLLDVQDHVASGVQLRFVIPPGHPARRLADLVDPGRRVPVYAARRRPPPESPSRSPLTPCVQREADGASAPVWGTRRRPRWHRLGPARSVRRGRAHRRNGLAGHPPLLTSWAARAEPRRKAARRRQPGD